MALSITRVSFDLAFSQRRNRAARGSGSPEQTMVIETVERTNITPYPDERGRYGRFGGQYAPETLMPALEELEAAWEDAKHDVAYLAEIRRSGPRLCRPPDTALRSRATGRGSRRRAHLPEARGSGAHRRAQDQQRHRPGLAGQADGQEAHHRGNRRRSAWRRHRDRLRAARPRMHRLHGRSRHRAPEAQCLPHEAAGRRGALGFVRFQDPQGRDQ